MPQKTLLSFFKPPLADLQGKKHAIEAGADNLAKKAKTLDVASNNNVPSSRAEENLFKAKLKLQAKKYPLLSTDIGLSWFQALEDEFQQPYFEKLCALVQKERKSSTIYPPMNQVFTWTNLCEISNVKVVILGQDPYHGPHQAHGLAFSVPVGTSIPPSLKNMYKELSSCISGFKKPNHGYLKGWAVQGVLLLNACLTVKAHNPNSHSNFGWEKLTDATIKWLSDNQSGIVFLLWGAFAQKKSVMIDKQKHLILTAPHPSPLSASRGFLGCRHFLDANEYLEKQKKMPIDWGNLPAE